MGNHTITICVAGENLHVEVRQSLVNIRYLYIPIIHLALFSISLWIYNPPKRTCKQYLCKILGGKEGVLWLMSSSELNT